MKKLKNVLNETVAESTTELTSDETIEQVTDVDKHLLNKLDGFQLQSQWIMPTPLTFFKTNFSNEEIQELIDIILRTEKEEKKDNIEQKSMQGTGGYHTRYNLLTKNDPIILKLKDTFFNLFEAHSNMVTRMSLTKNVTMEAWGMIYRNGSYSVCHQHPGADLSSAFYLKVPKKLPQNEGNIVFLDPRPSGRFANFSGDEGEIEVPPTVGTGAIFPSWLEHYVKPHFQDEERIAIAFNLYLNEERSENEVKRK
jgi:uncharacterized protein (TIGR02466 family)